MLAVAVAVVVVVVAVAAVVVVAAVVAAAAAALPGYFAKLEVVDVAVGLCAFFGPV